MSATMKLHPYVIQPEGAERGDLLAKRAMLSEGIRHMRAHLAARLREIRRDMRTLQSAEAQREEINRKLRGES